MRSEMVETDIVASDTSPIWCCSSTIDFSLHAKLKLRTMNRNIHHSVCIQ